jgi:hypothetical protein
MTKKIRLFVGKKHIRLASALDRVRGGINNPIKLALIEKLAINRDDIVMKNHSGYIDIKYDTKHLNRVCLRAPKTPHYYKWFKKWEQYKAKPTHFRLTFSEIES